MKFLPSGSSTELRPNLSMGRLRASRPDHLLSSSQQRLALGRGLFLNAGSRRLRPTCRPSTCGRLRAANTTGACGRAHSRTRSHEHMAEFSAFTGRRTCLTNGGR